MRARAAGRACWEWIVLESPEEIDAGNEAQDTAAAERAALEPARPEMLPREPRIRKLDIVSRRNLFFLVSLVIIIPGIISMARPGGGFLLGIDFPCGTKSPLQFPTNPSLPPA